jgi:hypothetical protein
MQSFAENPAATASSASTALPVRSTSEVAIRSE